MFNLLILFLSIFVIYSFLCIFKPFWIFKKRWHAALACYGILIFITLLQQGDEERSANLKEEDPVEYERIMAERQLEIDELYKRVKTIQKTDTNQNLEIYEKLNELDPDNEIFASKVEYYTAQKKAELAERNAEKARAAEDRKNERKKKSLKAFLIVKAQNAVRERLKDPDSAKFGKTVVVESNIDGKEIMVACGYVNARNSFGGYMGDQAFISNGVSLTFLQSEVQDFSKAWNQLCASR